MSADTGAPLSPLAQLRAQLRAEAAEENVTGLTEADLGALAESLEAWVEEEDAGQTRLRLREAVGGDGQLLARTLLEVVGPDMPFLVDSLLNECTAHGHEVLSLFHPVVTLPDGERRSAIQIHLPQLTRAEGLSLTEGARAALRDVATSVADYEPMEAAMQEEATRLAEQVHLPDAQRKEALAFLDWLVDEHFVFLGKRTYTFRRDEEGNVLPEEPDMVEGSNLGLLRDETLNVLNPSSEPAVLTPQIGAFLQRSEPLIIAKSTMVSRVHRRVNADYVGIKHYDEGGRVCGETRFLGLFTAEAYHEPARAIPLVRERVRGVLEQADVAKGGHSENALLNLLETWPRDELFQADTETLAPMLLGALHLIGRPRTRMFVRADEFDRFVTILVYVPRDAYNTDVRIRMGKQLEEAFGGEIIHFEPRFDGTPLARVHFRLALPKDHRDPDLAALEAEITRIARTWDDAYREAVSGADLSDLARTGAVCFRGAFNAAYREAFTPEEAIRDVAAMAELGEDRDIALRGYRPPDRSEDVLCAKIYAREGSIPLSQCVPVFENMGLFVEFETGYPVRPSQKPAPSAPDTYWVHALSMHTRDGSPIDVEAVAGKIANAFVAIWHGQVENDGFNRLLFTAGANWHEIDLIRSLSAYRQQSGRDPSRETQIEAFNAHPRLTRLILDLFAARFDPATGEHLDTRKAHCEAIHDRIVEGLTEVSALDDDRVIRRTADLVMALQRTNFYQRGHDGGHRPAIGFKVASRELTQLPDPKPYREIFVASPRVEGVHCRFGAVARGGLRWSDRRDDFRTEVLGLVKAQQVKNAVIVPVGAKGGFYPKHVAAQTSREAVREIGIAAYREFVTCLLELTDNIVDEEVRPPADTVVWDGEDAYLVVAADKGTASFSDIANEISISQGFWLGDAFASGGSTGYDHKKMGITARGGWEAVKRHFREIGKDIQSDPFTVIGVGDMSGDVFGNGMLLSKQIRLVAAFNHLDIFIDPDPQDPEHCWQERKRLFDLPRSSWADYDKSLISKGGGVFERSAKAIPLSDEIRALTGLTSDSVTPNELIHALLQAEAELLWFGGIGTYVKATHESHGEAGDRANDAVRVNADELKVKIIGEGANLGLTQAARIEFARHGGRLNTDAIDNSAGVDSSDHEVNIKILCAEAIRAGDLPRGERNHLLETMTDEVAAHVLAHNYDQTGALSFAEARAESDHSALERLMVALEARGVLDRELEALPGTAEMGRRKEAGRPLTRPELAAILAWSKITLFDDIVASSVPDDPWFEATLLGYFPEALRGQASALKSHPLRREIIATILANRLLDTCGPATLQRLREATGQTNAEITRAFEIGRSVLSAEDFLHAVDSLDNKVPARVQLSLRSDLVGALTRASEWFALHYTTQPVGEVVDLFDPPLDGFKAGLRETASPFAAARIERRARTLIGEEVPEPLARWSAAVGYFAQAVALVPVTLDTGEEMDDVARTFFQIGDQLRLDRLRTSGEDALPDIDYWDRVATRRLIEDLLSQQIDATRQALDSGGVEAWLETRQTARRDLLDMLRQLTGGHSWSFSRFTLATDAVRRFMAGES